MGLAGIELSERHRELLERRSLRLGIGGGPGFDALLDSVERGDPRAAHRLIQLVTTKFTGFFRHPRHFEIATEHVMRAGGRVRLWSAAASTGEEPYSLAMALIEKSEPGYPAATILATDIDSDVLEIAGRGEYGELALGVLGRERRARFFAEPAGAGRWRLSADARRLVAFRVLNLTGVAWPIEGPFDVVFCRNVLMYLEGCHRYSVLEHMASLLVPEGLLFLDPAEHIGKAGHWFTSGGDGVYRRRRVAAAVPSRCHVHLTQGQRG